MEGFLIFVDGGDDAACYPLDSLISITCDTNAELKFNFKSSVGKNDGADTVAVTITADKEKKVLKSLLNAIANLTKDKNYIVVSDDVGAFYFAPDVGTCVITLDT